jgi:ribosomal protein S18 acetylase RimI-like enzyme
MNVNYISYQIGIPEQYRETAVELYEEAFGKKLGVAIKDKGKRLNLLNSTLILKYAIGAFSDEKLIAIAGFQTAEGSLTNGIEYRELLSQLGLVKGNWAALIFSIYERKPKPMELVMDGISVHSLARGKGIGTKLLAEIKELGKNEGYKQIRLDVIDINPKAKELYERVGFETVKTESYPFLKGILGFSGSSTMVFKINKNV